MVLDIGRIKWEELTESLSAVRREQKADAMNAAEELGFYLDFYIKLYQHHKDLLEWLKKIILKEYVTEGERERNRR